MDRPKDTLLYVGLPLGIFREKLLDVRSEEADEALSRLKEAGRLSKAERVFLSTLEDFEQSLKLLKGAPKTDEYREALKRLQSVSERLVEAYGPDYEARRLLLRKMALCRFRLGEKREAARLLEESIRLDRLSLDQPGRRPPAELRHDLELLGDLLSDLPDEASRADSLLSEAGDLWRKSEDAATKLGRCHLNGVWEEDEPCSWEKLAIPDFLEYL